ncbi:hypothetical protein [Pseudomonas sp. B21-035]|uniref:hypothetical protein n=1 Tax=Pseudomonas sp. B21-035 TaxID=2895484 RepID=UPI00215FE516|nr:hypothetical protein [Pseudomonas sp. B21-035]UVL54120.1 hypothetical protein LOY22_14640 [Pseudomonas sp. B21-035]
MARALMLHQIPLSFFVKGGGIAISMACCVLAISPAYAAEGSLQTRVVWQSTCPSDPPPPIVKDSDRSGVIALIAAAMAPKLIEGAVDMAAEALKAAGQTKTTASTAKSADYFYKVSQEADILSRTNCLVVVRGEFEPKSITRHEFAAKVEAFHGLTKLHFYYEAKLNRLRGLQYFQLTPNYLEVTEFDHWRLFGTRKRDFIVAVTLTVPGGAAPFGSAEMTFKDIRRGEKIKAGDWRLSSASTLPIAFPPASADATKAKEKQEARVARYLLALDILNPKDPTPSQPESVYLDKRVVAAVDTYCAAMSAQNLKLGKDHQLHDDRCNYSLTADRERLDNAIEAANSNKHRKKWAGTVCDYRPARTADKKPATCESMGEDVDLEDKVFTYFVTQLTLSETSEGSKFALYLGNALSSSKEEVSTVLKGYIPKSADAKDADKASRRAAREDALLADLEVQKAEEALADALLPETPVAVDVTSARIALLKAKIAANEAHRKAGTSVPFPLIPGV